MAHKKESDDEVQQITLMYMSSYGVTDSKEVHDKKTNTFSNEDRRFYKKRILELVKDMLRGNKVPESLRDSGDHFMAAVVRHLKEIDRRDIIQSAYRDITDLPPILEDDEETRSVDEANELIMHIKKSEPSSTLDGFVERSGGHSADPGAPPPQKKIINLADPQLRTKGIEGGTKVKRSKQKGR